MTQLFDEITRGDTEPANHAEDSYSYYNRSARVGVARIRALLQTWFDRYPAGEKPELAARFRADFDAAFFELFLHEVATRLGSAVLVHPELGSSSLRRPDFQLSEPAGTCYLEARVARDESSEETRRRRVVATVYDQINKL